MSFVGDDKCCPLDSSGCGCWPAGGARSKGCGSICDGDPSKASVTYDEEGCPVLHVGYGSCGGTLPDTGTTPTDSEADTDASETGVECCPIAATPSCDCYDTGGSKSQPGGCTNICDSIPPAATKSVDKNGCPIWIVGPGSCLDTDAGPG
jgi:hypothetical protein